MLNPDEDTEWNDILRSKGILPPKTKEAEITEQTIVEMMEKAIAQKQSDSKDMTDMNLDELDELEDDEDESVLLEYRRKRIAEMQAAASKSRFGDVREISGQDYVSEVNKAGDGIWVVLHLYKQGIPLCALLNRFMNDLAQRYPQTKFLKSIASTCIPNFPEANLPSIFIYYEGDLKKQVIGSVELRGEKITAEEFEYIIGRYGAIETDIKEDPRTTVKDKMLSDLSDTNDW